MGSNGKGAPIFAPGECAAAKFYVDHRKEVSPCTKYQLIEKFADQSRSVRCADSSAYPEAAITPTFEEREKKPEKNIVGTNKILPYKREIHAHISCP